MPTSLPVAAAAAAARAGGRAALTPAANGTAAAAVAAPPHPPAAFALRSNLTLLGAPGSGKGFYGRLLADAWQVPLYSASRILRQQSSASSATASCSRSDLDAGNLFDCDAVCRTLLSFLLEQQPEHPAADAFYIMDGFPRTPRQVDVMRATWPEPYHLSRALHLNVPDAVCALKIAGRRVCAACHQEPNIAHVQHHVSGFVLPPTLPVGCRRHRCRPATDWTRRPDDASDIVVAKRLAVYRHHERPLLHYYATGDNDNDSNQKTKNSTNSNLCSFTPYRGILDFPQMQQTLEDWLSGAAS